MGWGRGAGCTGELTESPTRPHPYAPPPRESTSARDPHARNDRAATVKLSGLLNTEIEVFAAENGTCYVQVVLNVTNVEFTQEMLDEYNAQLPPLKRALEINREQTEGWVQRLLRLQLRCFTPIVK